MSDDQLAYRLAEEINRLGGVMWASRLLGVSRSTIANWRKKPVITLEQLNKLAEAGANIDYILGRGEPRPSSSLAEARETPPPYIPDPAGDGSFSERAAHELVRRLDHARPLVDRLMEVYGFQRAPMLHAALCLLASSDGVGVKELALLAQAIKDYVEKTKQEGKP